MNKRGKYSYSDWWEGRIVLNETSNHYNVKDEPIFVSLSEITKSDIPLIKEKQKELFEQQCEELSNEWKNKFYENYERSELKESLVNRELADLTKLLFSNSELRHRDNNGYGSLELDNYNWVFSSFELSAIREYHKNVIELGRDRYYDFMHSPNCQFQNTKEIIPQVFAQVCWSYYKWLFDIEKQDLHYDIRVDQKTKIIVDETDKDWFKVGLLFATGVLNELFEKHMSGNIPNFSAVARELGDMNYRQYLAEGYNNVRECSKNIFRNSYKMNYVTDYCLKHNIDIIDSFSFKAE